MVGGGNPTTRCAPSIWPAGYAAKLRPNATSPRSRPRSRAPRPWPPSSGLPRPTGGHAATTDQWDADPWLLNTPGGVVDLRTGADAPARPDDYMTKITAVAPGGDCPLWLAVPRSSHRRRSEPAAFLQRVAGYALNRRHTRARAVLRLRHRRATARACSSTRSPASWATTTARRRSRPSPLSKPTGTRPTSPACAARGWSPRSRPRRAAAGPRPHQGADRRRQDRRAVHAAGLLRVHAAVQAADRRQPQAGPAQRRRGDPPPLPPHSVQRHHSGRRSATRTLDETSSRRSGPASSPG